MNKYTIKQRINNNSIPPTIYDDNPNEKKTCLCIAQRKGKYGILAEDDDIFLPFEYDNITMIGFSLYLLIKGGKMGLLHAARPSLCEDQPFDLKSLIPCEYDLITTPKNGESFVFLRKDQEKDSLMQAYFIDTCTISEPFWREEYNDRDYLIITELDHRTEKIFHKSGKCLYTTEGSEKATMLCSIYETYYGTVFVDVKEDESVSLVLAEKKKREDCDFCEDDYYYELTGIVKTSNFDSYVRPILASEHLRTFERPFVFGFVVEAQDDYFVLDGKCEKLHNDAFDNLIIDTVVRSRTGRGIHANITINRTNLMYEKFTNTIAKGYEHFYVDSDTEDTENLEEETVEE